MLELVMLQGGIVTSDAMGCQKKIVEVIRAHPAEYENTGALKTAVTGFSMSFSRKMPPALDLVLPTII
ncbi:MAG: hypothetical protein ABI947_10455 [Chloroflexota bacterium]